MHVLCKVGKNIIFQNKTLLVMFYRHNKTFWYHFVIFNIFWKQKIVKTVWPVRVKSSMHVTQYDPGVWYWVTIGTTAYSLLCPLSLPQRSTAWPSGVYRLCTSDYTAYYTATDIKILWNDLHWLKIWQANDPTLFLWSIFGEKMKHVKNAFKQLWKFVLTCKAWFTCTNYSANGHRTTVTRWSIWLRCKRNSDEPFSSSGIFQHTCPSR